MLLWEKFDWLINFSFGDFEVDHFVSPSTSQKKPHGEWSQDLWAYRKIKFCCIDVKKRQLQEVRNYYIHSIIQEVRGYIQEVRSII